MGIVCYRSVFSTVSEEMNPLRQLSTKMLISPDEHDWLVTVNTKVHHVVSYQIDCFIINKKVRLSVLLVLNLVVLLPVYSDHSTVNCPAIKLW